MCAENCLQGQVAKEVLPIHLVQAVGYTGLTELLGRGRGPCWEAGCTLLSTVPSARAPKYSSGSRVVPPSSSSGVRPVYRLQGDLELVPGSLKAMARCPSMPSGQHCFVGLGSGSQHICVLHKPKVTIERRKEQCMTPFQL